MQRLIPTTPADLNPGWLTDCLRANGTLAKACVIAAKASPIGVDASFTGGSLYRISLAYDHPEPAAPGSLVAKLAPTNPEMRAIMQRANCREVAFYRSLAGQQNPPVAQCYHADFDAETGASILLLQDLTSLRAVPFTKGCGPADAKRVIEALATLHAKWWNAPALSPLSGASLLDEYSFAQVWPHYMQKMQPILQGIEIPTSFLKLGDFIAQNEGQVFTHLFETAPITRLHRDVQADNVLFAKPKGRAGAILFDWQFSGKGRGAYDVGYFLISSVDHAQRRNMERGLVAHYNAELHRLGVTAYSLAQCWADYVQSVAGKMHLTVVATVLLDNASPHKQAWRRADLIRLLAFCADHRVSAKTFQV